MGGKSKKKPISVSDAGKRRWSGTTKEERARFMSWVANIRWQREREKKVESEEK